MKQFIVIKVYGPYNSSVVFTTDIKEDAYAYSEIMHRSDEYEYQVAEVMPR